MPRRRSLRARAALCATVLAGAVVAVATVVVVGGATGAPAGATVVTFGDARAPGDPAAATAGRRVAAMASTLDGGGYWLAARDGGVFAFGSAVAHSSPEPRQLNHPIVGMTARRDGSGYWLVASDGGVFAFGAAAFLGSTGDIRLNQPIVGMAATPDGRGYWLVARDGGVFTFGAARFLGSTGGMALNQPIVGMAATPDGRGYWLVARDGGVFAFGAARFLGSAGDVPLNQPIVGMAATPDGQGYWMAARDGGVFTYGAARFHGSGVGALGAGRVAAGIVPSPTGQGYAMLAVAGSVRVSFGGDVHGVDRVATFMERGGDPLAGMRPVFAAHDATIVNLETAVGSGGQRQRKQYTFQSPPVLLQRLMASGVSVVSLANNHSLDFGPGALLETIAHARDARLLVVGAGANKTEAFAPAIVSAPGGTVAFIGLSQVVPPGWAATASSPGVASAYDIAAATAAVRSARGRADHVVVLVHAGTEQSECPTGKQRSLGDALVDAGADVVAGAHPHVLQGIVRRGSSVIAYSLGNFVWYSGNPLTGLLSADIGSNGVENYDFLPARIDDTGSPQPLSGDDATAARGYVASLAPGAGRCS